MSKIPANMIRRQSLWEAHGKRCFYCDKLLLFGDCEIDHIISQDLKKKPKERKRIFKHYGLPNSFEIDSIENQVPCHPHCNKKKGNKRYSQRTIAFYIEQASEKADKVGNIEQMYTEALEKDYGQALINLILERGLLSKADILNIIEQYELAKVDLSDETQVITFSLIIEELLESGLLPDDAPRYYPYLCDWLQEDLVDHLASIISTPFYCVEDKRDGDVFSLRVVLIRLSKKEFSRFSIDWWEKFHEGKFSEVYGESPSKYFKKHYRSDA